MFFLSLAAVICVVIICGTTVRLHETRHVHKWWTEGQNVVHIYAHEDDKIPVRHETHFAQSCEGCGEKRIHIARGNWKGLDD